MAADSRIARAFRRCRTLVFVSGVSVNLVLLDQLAKFFRRLSNRSERQAQSRSAVAHA